MNGRIEAMFGDRAIGVEADFVAFRAPDGVERQFSLQSVECAVRSEHVFAFQVNSKVYGVLYKPDNEDQRRVIEALVERLRQSAGMGAGDNDFVDAQF
ncbi:MAG TPA: hypothetical protein VGQ99_18425 [Tepidisphaeraceae bacterium]|jgi:hypothetical protein|nr:hypothetical protein [Tepidisphaeraceae bacterium]